MRKPRNSFDSPWKEAICLHLSDFFEFFFPEIGGDIDWSQGFQFLDKELRQVTRDAELGKRDADVLARLTTLTGKSTVVYAHLEVQSQRETDFETRIYVYNYRIFDKYGDDVVSLVVLGDNSPSWRPTTYSRERWGFSIKLTFPTVKLSEIGDRRSEYPNNPFPWLVLAHMEAQKTDPNSPKRLRTKTALLKGLYECGLSKKQIIQFFRLIDWALALSPPLQLKFEKRLTKLEEEKNMPYITSIERSGELRGELRGEARGEQRALRKTLGTVLRSRWGEAPASLLDKIASLSDTDQLSSMIEHALKASSIAEWTEASFPSEQPTLDTTDGQATPL